MRRALVLAVLLLAAPAFGAVDTAAKRASVVNMAGHVLPIPAGGVTESDRAHLAMVYAGFDYSEVEPMQVAVPNVIGQADFAAADAILEGDGLDGGTETESCSAETENEIIRQNPAAGVEVDLGTLVDVVSSSGTPCSGRPLSISLRERLGL